MSISGGISARRSQRRLRLADAVTPYRAAAWWHLRCEQASTSERHLSRARVHVRPQVLKVFAASLRGGTLQEFSVRLTPHDQVRARVRQRAGGHDLNPKQAGAADDVTAHPRFRPRLFRVYTLDPKQAAASGALM